jgi:hypothetical protein
MTKCDKCHRECDDDLLHDVITNQTGNVDDIVHMCLPCLHEWYEMSPYSRQDWNKRNEKK